MNIYKGDIYCCIDAPKDVHGALKGQYERLNTYATQMGFTVVDSSQDLASGLQLRLLFQRRITMITGCLQEKNNTYYALLYLKVDGKRKAKKAFEQIRLEYEQAQEVRKRREAEEKLRERIEGKKRNPDADILFIDYLQKWLLQTRPTIARSTYNSYQVMMNGRLERYFRALNVTLAEVTPQHIQDFHQSIFDEYFTPNTVIHYHAMLRKALQTAVKRILLQAILRISLPLSTAYAKVRFWD